MERFVKFARRVVVEEDGQDLVEYAMLVGLIAIVAGVGVTLTGTAISDGFSNLADDVTGWLP
jgi:Flp pilus assembly pilin Flp